MSYLEPTLYHQIVPAERLTQPSVDCDHGLGHTVYPALSLLLNRLQHLSIRNPGASVCRSLSSSGRSNPTEMHCGQRIK